MFDDLYTQLTKRADYKKLIFVPVILAILMICFIPSIELGIELKGGTSIDVSLNQPMQDNEIKLLSDELSSYGLENVEVYLKSAVGTDKRTLSIETTTTLASEDEGKNIIKILEKHLKNYAGDLDEFDTARVKLADEPSKDTIEKLCDQLKSKGVMINTDDISYDENENLLTIRAFGLTPDKLRSPMEYQLKDYADEISIDIHKSNIMIAPISASLGGEFKKQGMKALLIAYILMAFVIFVAFSRDISYEAVVLMVSYIILVILLMNWGKMDNEIAVAAAMLIYLLLMVIFIKYKLAVPASAVIAAATCDVIIAIGGMAVFGIELEPASFAALLMLIGYSVDSDVLLTSRTIKRKVGTVEERINDAMKTGLTMTGTTTCALLVIFIISSLFAQIEILTAITSVLLIGLVADMMTTWLMNAGVLKWYLEQPATKRKKFKFGFSIFSK